MNQANGYYDGQHDALIRNKMQQAALQSADQKQVGGNHYKYKAIQPWEVIERNSMGFFDGNALKYIMRYKEKGGVEDLKKAIHYIEKLIEMDVKNSALKESGQ